MSGTALWSVQQSLYSRLTADATLMALLGVDVAGGYKVYDGAPDGTQYPYIDIGDGDEQPFRTFGSNDGHETFKTVRIWTQDDRTKKGFQQGLAIYERVNTLLDGYALPVAAHTTVLCQLEDVFQLVDTDGVTRQMSPTYRVITQ